MASSKKEVEFIPTLRKQLPPTKYMGREEDEDIYAWYITEDEYLRLNKLFGRDFQETALGATVVSGLPTPCNGCGKYTEFIDWVWTALRRGVHSREFMFKALKESRQGMENSHDVYCSECGLLTACRSTNNAEGGKENIHLAGSLRRSSYQPIQPRSIGSKVKTESDHVVVWGKWWLDNNGSIVRH
ncbi:hypothetical protein M408DRAFT_29813 [Serendipita vermifera MAFF 305830]|uniref:Uncharacterized protein n=1 Tax=Serendipita vermifera MAFF 305830 TaxID=933852 RepID=A0A0C2W3S9_SERVB|nr:hypothetical protein M408DRAFT_29813 [Serendipita vermifera MAFF 305830]